MQPQPPAVAECEDCQHWRGSDRQQGQWGRHSTVTHNTHTPARAVAEGSRQGPRHQVCFPLQQALPDDPTLTMSVVVL